MDARRKSAGRSAWRWLVALSLLALCASPRAATPAAEAPAATVRVAAVQFMSEFGNPSANRKRAEVLIRQAAAKGAKIVVLPETAITGYMNYELDTTWQSGEMKLTMGLRGVSPATVAETVPGPSTEAFSALARELGIYLTVPFLEVQRDTGAYYNSVCLAGPDGRLLLHYRKLNPWPFAERSWAAKGDRGLQTVDTPYGRLALLICYDINSEPPNLKALNVDTLLYSIAWVDKADSEWFKVKLPGIARANALNIIGANWTVPRKPSWHGYGQSLIIDKSGQVLTRAADDVAEEILYADLPLPAGR